MWADKEDRKEPDPGLVTYPPYGGNPHMKRLPSRPLRKSKRDLEGEK